MKEKFKEMLRNAVGSRKFMFGLPVLIALVCFKIISGEVFIAGFMALFAVNSFDKLERMKNGKQ